MKRTLKTDENAYIAILNAINDKLNNIAVLYKNLQLLVIKLGDEEYDSIIHIYCTESSSMTVVIIRCNDDDEYRMIEISNPELFNEVYKFVKHLMRRHGRRAR